MTKAILMVTLNHSVKRFVYLQQNVISKIKTYETNFYKIY